MYRSKNRGDAVSRTRVLFERDEFPVQLIQALVALDQEFLGGLIIDHWSATTMCLGICMALVSAMDAAPFCDVFFLSAANSA
jgi:hypothetical protein